MKQAPGFLCNKSQLLKGLAWMAVSFVGGEVVHEFRVSVSSWLQFTISGSSAY